MARERTAYPESVERHRYARARSKGRKLHAVPPERITAAAVPALCGHRVEAEVQLLDGRRYLIEFEGGAERACKRCTELAETGGGVLMEERIRAGRRGLRG